MTLQTTAVITDAPGNGVTTAFPTGYQFQTTADLLVQIVDDATGNVDSTLVLGVDYTVTGRESPDGGTVSCTTAPATGKTLRITRDTAITQDLALSSQTNYDPAAVMRALDKLTQIAQEIWRYVSRALRLVDGDTDGSGRYDANSNRIVHVGEAVEGTDAANLQQVADLVNAAQMTPGLLGTVIGDVVLSGSYRTFGGVIRQTVAGAGWAYIDDSGHHPVGMTGTVTLNGDGSLTLPMSWTADHVMSTFACVDEAYAAAGLTVGASIARDEVVLFFYGPWQVRLFNLTPAWGNYLTTGSSVDTSTALVDGIVTFAHPAMVFSDAQGPAVHIGRYAPGGNENFVVASAGLGKSGFKIQAQDRIGGLISVSGGVITVTSSLVTPPTCVWDAANNRFTVTHATTPQTTTPSATPASAGYLPVVESAGTTTLRVAMYDYTGTKFTGASPPNCAFYFTRSGFAPAVWNASNRLWISRGIVQLDANNIGGAGANIWFGGTHKA